VKSDEVEATPSGDAPAAAPKPSAAKVAAK
jgi:hypothetical protein